MDGPYGTRKIGMKRRNERDGRGESQLGEHEEGTRRK